jgi:hypothetical protein
MMLVYQLGVLAVLVAVAGMVWRNLREYRRPAAEPPAPDAPLVSILIPARNEAENIEACLRGLLRQDYPAWELVVLDDASTDDTAARVRRLMAREPRLRLLRGSVLPPGWAGKAHACWNLARAARGEWLLFLDADTRHEPELVSHAVAEARRTGADLLSTFPRQVTGTPGEALTVPFIYWVLFTLLPVWKVWEDPRPAFAAGCGQLLLVRRDAYFETAGHSAVPSSLHDGLHLARRFKELGKAVRLADLSEHVSCRMYCRWRECWDGFSRNAWQAVGSLPALVLLTAVQLVLFLLPFPFLAAAAFLGWPAWAWPVLGQVLIVLGIQTALRARFRYRWLTVLLHPAGLAAVLAIQWRSWWRAVRGERTVWKGREAPTTPRAEPLVRPH